MLLLIDAGNTRVKWALAAPGAAPGSWLAHGAATHTDADAAAMALMAQQWRAALDGAPLGKIVVANVAGAAVRARLQQLLEQLTPVAADWFASLPQRAGLTNGYRNPQQLGCDRFAAAIAGHVLAPGRSVIVANCGTATTIDAITADGVFLGGMILPGLGLMTAALARNTAQLPQVAQHGKLPDGFADNTDDAILSGCLAAQGGAIEHACALHGADVCIVSGGAAPAIAPVLKVAHRIVDNIVLVGLHAAALAPSP